MSGSRAGGGPYKGQLPFEEADWPIFFGREADRVKIASNLKASRLTLLYGPSGVGKSSVLRAGVAHDIKHLAEQSRYELGGPEFAVAVFDSWRGDPVAALKTCIRNAVEQVVGRPSEVHDAGLGLTKSLEVWCTELDCDLLVILDQFEEYLMYHPDGGRRSFAVEFARAVSASDLRANFLVALREDALARLDRFKGRVPRLFENYLRLDHLDRRSAEAAIIGPLHWYNSVHPTRDCPVEIEAELVDAVLEQVDTGRLLLGDSACDSLDISPSRAHEIEASFLQLVITRLWEAESRNGSRTLRLTTLQNLGGAESIVRDHFHQVIRPLPFAQRKLASVLWSYIQDADEEAWDRCVEIWGRIRFLKHLGAASKIVAMESGTPSTAGTPSRSHDDVGLSEVPADSQRIFISYSHKDRRWLDKLLVNLTLLKRREMISVWDDTQIRPSLEWRKEITRALESSQAAVLLVSPNYLASDFIAKHELRPLLDSAKRGAVIILWIAVSASLYEQTDIADYQALNDPARPLDRLNGPRQAQELVTICKRILAAVDSKAPQSV